MGFYVQCVVSGLVLGSIYALVALGFAVIYKATSVVNFAQGEFLMIGSYFCLAMVVQCRLPWIWAFLLTLAFSAALAVLVERLVLRPMVGEPVISTLMLTIALSMILRSVVMAVWGTQIRVYEPPLFPEAPVDVAGVAISPTYLWSVGLSLALVVLFGLFFKYSRIGVAMRATAFSQQVALSMGIGVQKIFALSWAVASVISAMGGILIGSINGVMARPRLLLLDEPSLGLAPLVVREIFSIIERINREEKVTMLLVEQNARLALGAASYAYVMEVGRVVLDGPSDKLRENEDVKEFYLGIGEGGARRSFRDVKHYRRRKRWLS